jgi:hypothetical protein
MRRECSARDGAARAQGPVLIVEDEDNARKGYEQLRKDEGLMCWRGYL